MNFNIKKYRCNAGTCNAKIPQVVCKRVEILRREIPHFVSLMDLLGDALISYHITHPTSEEGKNQDAFDKTWIVIWVDPRKHADPEYLVKAAANVAMDMYSDDEEVIYIQHEIKDGTFKTESRELNCPVCKKNYLHLCNRAMTLDEYHKHFAASAGIHE